jgi:hypothetical protein
MTLVEHDVEPNKSATLLWPSFSTRTEELYGRQESAESIVPPSDGVARNVVTAYATFLFEARASKYVSAFATWTK